MEKRCLFLQQLSAVVLSNFRLVKRTDFYSVTQAQWFRKVFMPRQTILKNKNFQGTLST